MRRDVVALGLACLSGMALGAMVFVLWPSPVPSAEGRAATPPRRVAPVLRAPTLTLFEAQAASRGPATPSAVEVGAPRLQGISIVGSRRRALVAFGGSVPVWLSVGESNGEWTLAQVSGDRARLRSASGEQELVLFPRSGPGDLIRP